MGPKNDTDEKAEQDRISLIRYLECGKRPSWIARRLRRSPSWVYKWWKTDVDNIYTKKRPGRPSEMTEATKKRIRATRGKRRQSCRKVAAAIGGTSPSSVWRFQTKEVKAFKRKKRPLLTHKNIQDRDQLARDYGDLHEFDYDEWLFEDEKAWTLHERQNFGDDWVWTNDPESIEDIQYPKDEPWRLMAIAFSSRGILRPVWFRTNETLNKEKYVNKCLKPWLNQIKLRRFGNVGDVMNNQLFADNNHWTYVNDGASPHTSNLAQNYMYQHFPNFLDKYEWPGKVYDTKYLCTCSYIR